MLQFLMEKTVERRCVKLPVWSLCT